MKPSIASITCWFITLRTFKGGQKLLVHNNRLWVTDISTREIVGVDIFRNVIEEYE